MTTEHRALGRRADDPACRLRLEISGGVDWKPIVRAALDIWVAAPLRARIADIEATIVELAGGSDVIAVELRQDGDGLVVDVDDRDNARGRGKDRVLTRRWAPDPDG